MVDTTAPIKWVIALPGSLKNSIFDCFFLVDMDTSQNKKLHVVFKTTCYDINIYYGYEKGKVIVQKK